MRTAREEEENPDVGAKAVAEERSAASDNVIESFIVVSVYDFLFTMAVMATGRLGVVVVVGMVRVW